MSAKAITADAENDRKRLVMVFSLMLVAGLAGMQTAQASAAPQAQPASVAVGPGRAFLSPMGEPFFGRTVSEDGLVVWFQQADRNHDGVLTSDEMVQDAERFFQILDRNHDGEIDPDDVSYYEGVIAPQLRVQPIFSATTLPGGDKNVSVDDESGAGRLGLLQIPEPVTSADTNWDRGVSPEEFRKAASKRFQALDTNHTGRLTLAALEETRHAAATYAKRQAVKPGASDNPTSAEYGAGAGGNDPFSGQQQQQPGQQQPY